MKIETIDIADAPKSNKTKWVDLLKELKPGKATKITFENGEDVRSKQTSIIATSRAMKLDIATTREGQTIFVFLKS